MQNIEYLHPVCLDKVDDYEYWRILFGASEKEFIEIKKEFIELNLKPGELLYDFTDLPKGIILINKGILRLVGKNEKNDLISINKKLIYY